MVNNIKPLTISITRKTQRSSCIVQCNLTINGVYMPVPKEVREGIGRSAASATGCTINCYAANKRRLAIRCILSDNSRHDRMRKRQFENKTIENRPIAENKI